MILISIKSEVVTDKRQFKSEGSAMRFLKRIERLYYSHRLRLAGAKPRKKHFFRKPRLFREAVENWNHVVNTAIPLKVEIINTKYNQLNLPI